MSDIRPSFQPETAFRQELLQTLRELERDPDGNETAGRQLRGWLYSREAEDTGPHLDLQELKSLADRRTREDQGFELPEHLLECRVCMEVFQVLCGESREGPAPESGRAGRLSDAVPPAARQSSRLRPKRMAALAAALLLGLLIWGYLRPGGAVLESGELRAGTALLRDGSLPPRVQVEALRQTRLRLLDGSSILLEPGTRFRTGRTAVMRPVIDIREGEARFDFRDPRAAPEIRAAGLTIPPVLAEFHLSASVGGLTLTSLRGEIHVRQGKEIFTLGEGETMEFIPGKSAGTGSGPRG